MCKFYLAFTYMPFLTHNIFNKLSTQTKWKKEAVNSSVPSPNTEDSATDLHQPVVRKYRLQRNHSNIGSASHIFFTIYYESNHIYYEHSDSQMLKRLMRMHSSQRFLSCKTSFWHFLDSPKVTTNIALLDDLCNHWIEGNKFRFEENLGKVLRLHWRMLGTSWSFHTMDAWWNYDNTHKLVSEHPYITFE